MFPHHRLVIHLIGARYEKLRIRNTLSDLLRGHAVYRDSNDVNLIGARYETYTCRDMRRYWRIRGTRFICLYVPGLLINHKEPTKCKIHLNYS